MMSQFDKMWAMVESALLEYVFTYIFKQINPLCGSIIDNLTL